MLAGAKAKESLQFIPMYAMSVAQTEERGGDRLIDVRCSSSRLLLSACAHCMCLRFRAQVTVKQTKHELKVADKFHHWAHFLVGVRAELRSLCPASRPVEA
jgi:hypothetical protein